MAGGKKTKLAGGAFGATALVLFGKETVVWAWNQVLNGLSQGLSGGVNLSSVPWQNLIASLFGVTGLALLLWPTKKTKPVTRADRLASLHARGWYITERIRHDRAHKWFERRRGEEILDITRDGISLLLAYESEGLAVPQFGEIMSAEKLCVGMELYYSTLGPFMRDGHVERVEAMAPGVAERAVVEATSFNPEKWYVDRYGH